MRTTERTADPALEVARALADPTRLRIFLALREEERCVRDLVASEGIAQPLASHHLRVLADAGLVETRRADRFRLYAVSPAGMRAALDALGGLLDPDGLEPPAMPGGNATCCR
ncbi:MAG TPA: metalloregulator ArsR/SmtB family transcription factor [Acidimicrobiales bacterium]|nr:metalloregulator ArsR/SmtB family transcription factor [Acidimicrobiales bacterium]